jgi:serine/threonine protein phosphatase 1
MDKRLFAIGDIHVCFNAFQILLVRKIRLIKSDKIILPGDYIDRGIQSKEVINYIIDLIAKGFDIIPLLGNHGAMKDIEPKYVEFFKGLSNYFAFEEYLFVHTGFNDTDINPFAEKYSMIWLCKQTYENPLLMNKIIINGHRPVTVDVCKEIVQSNKNVINLDTGCVYSNMTGYGTLTAIELNSRSLYFA